MRLVFLIPDLVSGLRLRAIRFAQRHPRISGAELSQRHLVPP